MAYRAKAAHRTARSTGRALTWRLGAVLVGMVVVGCAAPRSASDSPTSTAEVAATTSTPTRVPAGSDGVVARVVDGDTIVVASGGRDAKVRLIGIDTPETVDPRKPVQCFGREASAHTKALLPAGTAVRLVRDVEATDRYGRTLAYVYRSADGAFINLTLVRDGYAKVSTYPPNVAHAEEFRAAEADARTNNRGLWSSC